MSISVKLHHATRYHYDRPVRLGPQIVRLRPAPHCRTPIARYALTVKPAQHFLNWLQDPHGNWLARVLLREKTNTFSVTTDLVADMAPINPFDFFVEPYAQTWPFAYPPDLRADLAPFLEYEPAGPQLKELLRSISREPYNSVDFLVVLNRRIRHLIRYVERFQHGVQTADETLTAGIGSCRDSAWLMVQLLRQLGLAARFVSGYLIQLRSEDQPAAARDGVERDSAALHAWAEVYLPGAGWIGLDPTSGLLCAEGHLPLAATPHYRSAAPITGTVEPCDIDFSYELSVRRMTESE